MLSALKTKTRNALQVAVVVAPWVIAMYLFYWLDSSGTWTSDTPHRGKISVVILASGMALSFLAKASFDKRERTKGLTPG